jgi:hypothetical protein
MSATFPPEILKARAALEAAWRVKAEVVAQSRRASPWERHLAADLLAAWKGELMERQRACLDKAYAKCRSY